MTGSRPEGDGDLIPPVWHARLRRGVRARLRAAVDADDAQIPLDLVLYVELQDGNNLAIRVQSANGRQRGTEVDGGVATLTPRERRVIDLVATGKATTEIAGILQISPATVRTHVRNAMEKVGAHTRAQLIAIVLAGAGREDLPSSGRDEAA